MKPRLLLRLMLRQSRGARGRLVFFAVCIAIGVAALVGVNALVSTIEAGIHQRSRELLGGDVEIESRRPLPDVDAYLPEAHRGQMARVDLTLLPTMVQNAAGKSRLAQLKAVDAKRGSYPLVGRLTLHPDEPLAQLLDERSVAVAPELMRELELEPESSVRIGGQTFRVRAVVSEASQRLQLSFALGPEVLMTQAGLARANLIGFGDRVRYRSVLAFPNGASTDTLDALKQALLDRLPGAGTFVEVETHDQAQPALRATLDRVQRFLGLVALLSLLLGCIGVAQTVSSWIAQSVQQTAVLRCLGLRPRDVLALHLGHVLLTALVGSLAGGAIGLLLPVLLVRAYPELIGESSGSALVAVGALLRGAGLGCAVALCFSLLPLTAVWKVSPARVLRNEAEPLSVPPGLRFAALSLAALSVFGAALSQAHDAMLAVWFTGGVIGLAGLLTGGALLLQRTAATLPRDRLPSLLWQGAAALVRPGAGTTGSIVALGLGTLVVLGISLVEHVVGTELSRALPADAPSVFLADVQPDQWTGVQALARAHHAEHVQSAPVVMARLASVNGRPVSELVREREQAGTDARQANWVLTREQRVTFQRALPDNNALVAGELWSRHDQAELSVEQNFARDLGVWIDSLLTLDIQGVPMEFVVSSIRDVHWRSFSPNFFLVAEPGYLEDAPQLRIGALRLAPASEQPFQDAITTRFPNITVVRVRSIIERASELLDQVALGVRLLGSFAILTGLTILIGAVAGTQLRRAREVALLKTLGVTRLGVVTMFALEYALRGAVAGMLGAAGAYMLAWGFTHQVLRLHALPSIPLCAGAVLATTLLSVSAGLLASTRALLVKPLWVLREA